MITSQFLDEHGVSDVSVSSHGRGQAEVTFKQKFPELVLYHSFTCAIERAWVEVERRIVACRHIGFLTEKRASDEEIVITCERSTGTKYREVVAAPIRLPDGAAA